MKKIIFMLLAFCGCQMAVAQVEIPYQEIPYNVNYHWGVIDVNIATGTVTMQCNGDRFYGTLNGTSIPWEGHIICVNDTLSANMGSVNGNLQETVDYQSGWYRRPAVDVFRGGDYNPADPYIYKNIAGQGLYDASNDSMEAITVTSDMLGMYYYVQVLNFAGLQPGERYRIPIQGPYSNEVVITYQGEGTYNAGGETYSTYDCMFEYGYMGRMSGYPVECKVGIDNKIPLFLSANLPVGRVEMLYAR